MTNTYLEHPAEDTLERYLLHRSNEQEIELVETHFIACESCVTRLEALEIQIAATKLALQELHKEQVAKSFAGAQKASWRDWLKLHRFSMAGAMAALVVALGVTPLLTNHSASEAQVSLVAYRGLETPSVPKGQNLHVNLNAHDLTANTVDVQLVDENGTELWHGKTAVHNQEVAVQVPAITASGAYLFRIYTPAGAGQSQGDLLREFAFRVQ